MRIPFDLIARGSLVGLIFVLGTSTLVASDAGRGLYKARCAQCHGGNGEGKASIKAPSLVSGEIRKMSDAELRSRILDRANGEMEHKASHSRLKQRLNDEQIRDLTNHIRNLQTVHPNLTR